MVLRLDEGGRLKVGLEFKIQAHREYPGIAVDPTRTDYILQIGLHCHPVDQLRGIGQLIARLSVKIAQVHARQPHTENIIRASPDGRRQ